MPQLKTYTDGKNIHSVDMMIAYVNTHNHPIIKINLEELNPQLNRPVWGKYTPKDVIDNIKLKKYHDEVSRIKNADTKFPIFTTKKHIIIDGYHRVAKLIIEEKPTVDAYVFEPGMLKKFLLDSNSNFVKVHQDMNVSDILELWNSNF